MRLEVKNHKVGISYKLEILYLYLSRVLFLPTIKSNKMKKLLLLILMVSSTDLVNAQIKLDWTQNTELVSSLDKAGKSLESALKKIQLLSDKLKEDESLLALIPKAELELVQISINEIEADLLKYDTANSNLVNNRIEILNKELSKLRTDIKRIQSNNLDKQAAAIAEQVTAKIDLSIKEIEKLGEYSKRINDLSQESSKWKTKYEDLDTRNRDLIKYYEKLPTTDEVENIVSTNVTQEMQKQIAELNKNNWHFGVGIIGVFGDRLQDGEYFVNADTLLTKTDVNRTTTLNFGLLLGYYIGRKKNWSIQTSIPILSIISSTSSDATLTTFLNRTSGALGLGFSPAALIKKSDKTLERIQVVLMWNVANFDKLNAGSNSIYIGSDLKFPSTPGTNLDPQDETYKQYFTQVINHSFAMGITVRLAR